MQIRKSKDTVQMQKAGSFNQNLLFFHGQQQFQFIGLLDDVFKHQLLWIFLELEWHNCGIQNIFVYYCISGA